MPKIPTFHLLLPIALLACERTDKTDIEEPGNLLEDGDGDGYLTPDDCDDSSATINPGAAEICDGIDNNCNGTVDEDVTSLFYVDADMDGFGNPDISIESCEPPSGYVANGSDCNDMEEEAYPSANEICDGIDNDCNGEVDEDLEMPFYIDADGDGFGDENNIVNGCEPEFGLVVIAGDCNDQDASISPMANEICDEVDNNCNGIIDDGVTTTFYADNDGDGFGDNNSTVQACTVPENHSTDNTDCDDLDSLINPNATELCDNVDNNCDATIDENTAQDASIFYEDGDEDGFGDFNTSVSACSQPLGYVEDATDCDDTNGLINPSATETCNNMDDDCDGAIDEEDANNASVWYQDSDGDTFGDANQQQLACTQPNNHVADNTDCDDTNSNINPAANELCNQQDDNCDGTIDGTDAIDTITSYTDADGDGFGAAPTEACEIPLGNVLLPGDCDDTSVTINPVALEVCDNVDNNCDGTVDENTAVDALLWYFDNDNDGYGTTGPTILACNQPTGYAANDEDCDDGNAQTNPASDEICDTEDNNCNGLIDENSIDESIWFIDYDGDGYGSSNYTLTECNQPTGYVADNTDCDDLNSTIHVGAAEICDDEDNDCDGTIDEGLAQTWYLDLDGDGHGQTTTAVISCQSPTVDHVLADGDCDDNDPLTSPSGSEGCDDQDQNCDGFIDSDFDEDGFSDATCGGSDCNDNDPTIFPQNGFCGYHASCQEILDQGAATGSGLYTIDVDGNGGELEFEVYCDMDTEGGGWTLCGIVDETITGDPSTAVFEGDYIDYSGLTNESFCVRWFEEAAPIEMMIHNTTQGGSYGEGEKMIATWNSSPFTIGNYNNHPLANCRLLNAGSSWSTCWYATHSGWANTSFSFTVNGLASGYSGNQDRRLLLGPTNISNTSALPWHNFGANTNNQNNANAWTLGYNSGFIYMR